MHRPPTEMKRPASVPAIACVQYNDPAQKIMIGTTLSHYRITAKLGEGGMGEVYLAEDTELDRKVALKLLPQEMAEDPERLERFKREAKAVAALNHPNIVTIHSIEEADGHRFLTMEHVEGDSLDKVITPGGLPLARLFDIAVPVAEALAVAHEGGIVHRDLKPANVMVTPDGRVKVLDFGLAKVATQAAPPSEDAATEAALTGEGTVMGTAPYMSPEQLQGQAVDHRTDIFSIGILLYEMATGTRPFQGDSGIALASSILKDTPSTVTETRADLPRHLGRIVHHCLEKEPRRRFQSALDVRNELDSLQEEIESGASSVVSAPMAASSPPAAPVSSDQVVSAPPASSGPVAYAAPPTPGPPATAPPAPATTDTSQPSAVTSGPVPAAPANRTGLWIGLTAALVVVAGVAWWMGRTSEPAAPGPGADSSAATGTTQNSTPVAGPTAGAGPSVAVLPFTDMSPEGDQEYFTNGLTVELINKLSHVGDLRVTGRRSAFKFKGSDEDLGAIGAQLNVGAILEGSVRKSGDQVRVSAELVNVTDGFQLWSETYDRTLQDIFTVQDEIATSVAEALQVTLLGESTILQDNTDVEAYTLLLHARFLMERGEIGDNERAVDALEEALEIDPDSAPIWADYGLAHMRDAFAADTMALRDAALQSGREALNRALQLDPGLAEAYSRLGWIEIQYHDFAAAKVATRRALDLAPNNPVVLVNAASLEATLGNLEEASKLDRRALEHDPMDLTIISNMTYHLSAAKRLEEAEENHRRLLELNPDYYRAHGVLGEVYLQQGKLDDARLEFEREAEADYGLFGLVLVSYASGDQEESDKALAELNELLGDESPFSRARAHAYRGEIDEAFRWLEKAQASKDSGLSGIKNDWTLENLHDDPRWPELLESVGLGE